MVVPIKDADRRALILQRLYDERHVGSWTDFPLPEIVSLEEDKIIDNICTQLQQAGLIEWKTVSGIRGGESADNQSRRRCNRRQRQAAHRGHD